MNICEFLHLNFNLKLDLLRQPRGGARGPGPREWGPRGSLTVHGGPGARGLRRPAPWVPCVSRTRGRGRLTAGPHMAAAGSARRLPRRHSRREVAEVGEDAAEPKETAPRREVVRGDDGGRPELDGDGGERERRRELDSGGEREWRVAETVEGGTGRVYIGLGGGESGRRRGKRARKIRPPLMAPARLGGKFPNESEGEREGKGGGKGEGITGSISHLLIARGADGGGGIRGG